MSFIHFLKLGRHYLNSEDYYSIISSYSDSVNASKKYLLTIPCYSKTLTFHITTDPKNIGKLGLVWCDFENKAKHCVILLGISSLGGLASALSSRSPVFVTAAVVVMCSAAILAGFCYQRLELAKYLSNYSSNYSAGRIKHSEKNLDEYINRDIEDQLTAVIDQSIEPNQASKTVGTYCYTPEGKEILVTENIEEAAPTCVQQNAGFSKLRSQTPIDFNSASLNERLKISHEENSAISHLMKPIDQLESAHVENVLSLDDQHCQNLKELQQEKEQAHQQKTGRLEQEYAERMVSSEAEIKNLRSRPEKQGANNKLLNDLEEQLQQTLLSKTAILEENSNLEFQNRLYREDRIKLENTKQQVEDLEREKIQLLKESRKLTVQQKVDEEHILTLQDMLESLQRERTELRTRIAGLSKLLTEARKSCEIADQSIKEMTQSHAKTVEGLTEKQRDLEEDLAMTKSKLASERIAHKQIKKEKKELENRVTEIEGNNAYLTEVLAKKSQLISKLYEEPVLAKYSARETEEKLKRSEEEYTALIEDYKKLSAIENELSALLEESKNARATPVSEQKAQPDHYLSTQNKSTQQILLENEELKAQIKKTEEQMHFLETQLKSKEQEIATVSSSAKEKQITKIDLGHMSSSRNVSNTAAELQETKKVLADMSSQLEATVISDNLPSTLLGPVLCELIYLDPTYPSAVDKQAWIQSNFKTPIEKKKLEHLMTSLTKHHIPQPILVNPKISKTDEVRVLSGLLENIFSGGKVIKELVKSMQPKVNGKAKEQSFFERYAYIAQKLTLLRGKLEPIVKRYEEIKDLPQNREIIDRKKASKGETIPHRFKRAKDLLSQIDGILQLMHRTLIGKRWEITV